MIGHLSLSVSLCTDAFFLSFSLFHENGVFFQDCIVWFHQPVSIDFTKVRVLMPERVIFIAFPI